jgi:hypothetical protein
MFECGSLPKLQVLKFQSIMAALNLITGLPLRIAEKLMTNHSGMVIIQLSSQVQSVETLLLTVSAQTR